MIDLIANTVAVFFLLLMGGLVYHHRQVAKMDKEELKKKMKYPPEVDRLLEPDWDENSYH